MKFLLLHREFLFDSNKKHKLLFITYYKDHFLFVKLLVL